MSEDDLITCYDFETGITRTRAEWRKWEAAAKAAGWRFSADGDWDNVLSDEEAAKRHIFPTRVDLEYISEFYKEVDRKCS